jgi:hypothetical protein
MSKPVICSARGTTWTGYPPIYHRACRLLIEHGAYPPDPAAVRRVIAQALWAVRAKYGTRFARTEARHLASVVGHFPLKGGRR